MKDYTGYSPAEFASDDDFICWVTAPVQHPELNAFWKQWMIAHPEQRDDIQEARLMIRAVTEEPQHLPPAALQQDLWQHIRLSTRLGESETKRIRIWSRWYSKAALGAVAVALAWIALTIFMRTHHVAPHQRGDGAMVEKQSNTTSKPINITLQDGTTVVLQPHSELRYPLEFSDTERDVVLHGEATFDVKPDAARPFVVQANELTLKVVGTRFRVRNFSIEKNVLVVVAQGKVRVEKVKKHITSQQTSPDHDVMLTANQQVCYERSKSKFIKSLVELPQVIDASATFTFRRTPLDNVFATLQSAYGIDVVFDEQALSDCTVTASLQDLPFYKKLDHITNQIGATYEVIDTYIVVHGKACNSPAATAQPKS